MNDEAHGARPAKPSEPFKVRPELLSPDRLAPNVQRLLATRTRAVEELADQGLAVVLSVAKLFVACGRPSLPRVGVIGGGAVGCAIVMKLLVHAYPSSCLALSTRQPERVPTCEALQSSAAVVMFEQVPRYDDNTRLARESDVVLLCVPPSQLKGVALQLKVANGERILGDHRDPLLVASALCGVSRERLAKACGTCAIVRIQALPTEEHSGKKVLEAIMSALSAFDATLSMGQTEDADQRVRTACVREMLLASSVSTGVHAAPGISWPTDWQHQLELRLSEVAEST